MPRFSPEETGALPDLQQALMQGFQNYMQMQVQPKQLAQDFLAKQLQNKMEGVKAQYVEPTAQANLELIHARKAKALQPSSSGIQVSANLGKALQDRERIGAAYGTDSPEYEMATDYAKKLSQGIRTSSRSAGTTSRGGKLSVAEEKAQAGGRVMDYLNPVLQANPYIGATPSIEIAKDQWRYKHGTPEQKKVARERLLKFGVASGLVAEHTSGTLLGQRIAATVPALAHQRKAATIGWPTAFEEQASLLPEEIQKEAKQEISRHLTKIKNMPKGGAQVQDASESDPLGLF